MVWGYNPGFSDTISSIQAGLAGINGLVSFFDAKNNGANTYQAVSYGLGNAAYGLSNAFLGNAIDKSTHSYLGTTMNSVIGTNYATTLRFGYPAMLTYNPMSFYSVWATPSFMFGGGIPLWGGFSCFC